MKLIGIIDSVDFKKKVLYQRELLKTESRPQQNPSETSNEQINSTLIEIRDLLKEIKNKQ